MNTDSKTHQSLTQKDISKIMNEYILQMKKKVSNISTSEFKYTVPLSQNNRTFHYMKFLLNLHGNPSGGLFA